MSNVSRLRVARYERLSAFSLAALMVLLACAAPALGDLVVTTDPTFTDVVLSVTDMVTGSQMAGMLVSVTFADTTTDSAVWAAGVGTAGSATSAAGWSLSQSGDTYFAANPWTLANDSGQAITEVTINAELGSIAFDLGLPPVILGVPIGTGTAGSNIGFSFDAGSTDDSLTGDAEYSRQIAITANAGVPVGDLWGVLKLTFTNVGAFASGGADLVFRADTDILVIPEASQILAFSAVGLVCGGAAYLRKRRAAKRA
jgi:hypothetical protein